MIDDPFKSGERPAINPEATTVIIIKKRKPVKWWGIALVVAFIASLIILAGCTGASRKEESEKLRQLEAAISTYQEENKRLQSTRVLESTVKDTPTADGGKLTTTLLRESTLTEETRALRERLEKTERERDEYKQKAESMLKVDPAPAMSLLEVALGAATGGGGALALLLPKLLSLLGQRGRLIDAVQAVKDELAGSDEKKREAANKAAQRATNDTDIPVIQKHKIKRKLTSHSP